MCSVGTKQGNSFFYINEKPCFLQWTQHSEAVKFLLTVFPILIAAERSTPSDHMAGEYMTEL